MVEPNILAYFMRDGFTYVGKQESFEIDGRKIDSREATLKDFIVMPTAIIAQGDKRKPEVVISQEYECRNKGNSIRLDLENKIGVININLALRERKD